jgi:hypothetical protein
MHRRKVFYTLIYMCTVSSVLCTHGVCVLYSTAFNRMWRNAGQSLHTFTHDFLYTVFSIFLSFDWFLCAEKMKDTMPNYYEVNAYERQGSPLMSQLTGQILPGASCLLSTCCLAFDGLLLAVNPFRRRFFIVNLRIQCALTRLIML